MGFYSSARIAEKGSATMGSAQAVEPSMFDSIVKTAEELAS